jgi:hypothetical protein
MNTKRKVYEALSKDVKKVELSLVNDISIKAEELKSYMDNLEIEDSALGNTYVEIDKLTYVLYDKIEDFEYEQEFVIALQEEIGIMLDVLREKANDLGLSPEELVSDYSSIEQMLNFNARNLSENVQNAYDFKERHGF